jgi:hypothetical protein
VIIAITVCLGFAEIVLRFLFPQPPSWLAIYQTDPELGHALLPNTVVRVATGETDWTVRTDGRGLRAGTGPQNERPCDVLWLGDSFAFGHGVEYEETFVALEQSRHPQTRICNAAVPGYGPVHYRRIAERLLGSGLAVGALWVATYVGNDFHDCVAQKQHPVNTGCWVTVVT